ncbi:MAG: hypothetical protein NW208_17695 [Bryobacter sp.]|nr:hypothetical protein [Bryobacter sp.]
MIVAVAAPIALLAFYFLLTGVNKDLDFAAKERQGVTFLRQANLALSLMGQYQLASATHNLEEQNRTARRLDEVFKEIHSTVNTLGDRLELDSAGLVRRGRGNLEMATILKDWQKLKQLSGGANLVERQEKQNQIFGKLGAMISHVGDTSNLILDPDLDTYYLMSNVVLTLPALQAKLVEVGQ